MPGTTIEGILFKKGETQSFGKEDKPFLKREFVVETTENVGRKTYKELIKMFVVNKAVDMLDRFDVGDYIHADCKIKGSRWENKEGKEFFFTEIIADWLKSSEDMEYMPKHTEIRAKDVNTASEVPQYESSNSSLEDETSDLPF